MTERTIWVIALIVLALLVMYGMRRGWVNRRHRQTADFPAFPEVPEGLADTPELLSAESGFYVGTTRASDWQDRIVVGDIGHRAAGTVRLSETGVLVERTGASPLWIPTAVVRSARVDHKLANKVMPGSGLLVITWQLGEHVLDTGFRADDKTVQTDWADRISELASADESPADDDRTNPQEER